MRSSLPLIAATLCGVACLSFRSISSSFASPASPSPSEWSNDQTQPATERERILAMLPPGFRVEQSKRFTVYTDGQPDWITTQLKVLERTHHQVSRFARRMGWDAVESIPRQTVILFARRDAYVDFARTHDDVRAKWVAGYYSPKHRWVVFYDIESNPALIEARTKLRSMQDDVQTMKHQTRGGGPQPQIDRSQSVLEHYRAHVDGERERVERFVQQVGTATTTHEATHQLLHAMGIQRDGVPYPFWISEGLATCFETDVPTEAFGPDRPFAPRESRLGELIAGQQMVPMRSFVAIADATEQTREHVDVLYHQAYGFTRWASRFRREELRAYLDLMNTRQPGTITADEHVQLFTSVFGDIDVLENAWLQHERGRR